MTDLLASRRVMILIPAYNEEASISFVVGEVRRLYPAAPVLVVNDNSADSTAFLAESAGARVLNLPYHLGLGGALQAGYRLAFESGFEYVVRLDGDGQHDPQYVPKLLEAVTTPGVQMAIGSRFTGGGEGSTSLVRSAGILLFRTILRPILGRPVHDPTSGYVAVNREALEVFSRSFPLEYPEIEALVVLKRRAFQFREVPVAMRARHAGRSTITPLKSIYYILHVLIGVLVNILIFDRRKWR